MMHEGRLALDTSLLAEDQFKVNNFQQIHNRRLFLCMINTLWTFKYSTEILH